MLLDLDARAGRGLPTGGARRDLPRRAGRPGRCRGQRRAAAGGGCRRQAPSRARATRWRASASPPTAPGWTGGSSPADAFRQSGTMPVRPSQAPCSESGPEAIGGELVVEVAALSFGHRGGVPLRIRDCGVPAHHLLHLAHRRQTENVEIVRGGRNAASASVTPGWSRTSRSTGLPHRRNRGTSRRRIRATVTATTGSSCPTRRRAPADRAAQPASTTGAGTRGARANPARGGGRAGRRARKRSTASSSRHCAKTARRRSCRRSGDRVGAPSRIRARHSAWSSPGTVVEDGGRISARAPTEAGSSARWKVWTVMPRARACSGGAPPAFQSRSSWSVRSTPCWST